MNEQLRDHVTSTSFVLTLGKTHTAALVGLSISIDSGTWLIPMQMSHFVPGIDGCRRRGLVVHHPPEGVQKGDRPPSLYYTITRAGQLVIELLKEAGIWADVIKEFGITIEKVA